MNQKISRRLEYEPILFDDVDWFRLLVAISCDTGGWCVIFDDSDDSFLNLENNLRVQYIIPVA